MEIQTTIGIIFVMMATTGIANTAYHLGVEAERERLGIEVEHYAILLEQWTGLPADIVQNLKNVPSELPESEK